MTRGTFKGTRLKAIRKRGFLSRGRSKKGSKIIRRRRYKSRKILTIQKKIK